MSRSFRILLAVVLLSVVGSAGYITYKVFFSNSARSIPLLKGSSVIEAVETLERMGVKARIEEEESALPRGTVIGQSPETGVKLRSGKIAILKVSRGSQKQPLPDVRGLPLSQAAQKLQDAGFSVGEIQKINHESPAGVVIAQTPASPAAVSPSREIGMLVSLGPAVTAGEVIVPDLVERDENIAVQLARESTLRPHVEYVYDRSAPQGMVVSMTPAAGSRTLRDAALTLHVASWDERYRKRSEEPTAPNEKSPGGAHVTVVSPGTAPEPDDEDADVRGTEPPTVTAQPGGEEPPAPQQSTPQPEEKKTANIRYQAPPVKNQTLVIEIIDKNGERRLLDRTAAPSENIKLSVPYEGEAVVTIYLGGNFVWQERYK